MKEHMVEPFARVFSDSTILREQNKKSVIRVNAGGRDASVPGQATAFAWRNSPVRDQRPRSVLSCTWMTGGAISRIRSGLPSEGLIESVNTWSPITGAFGLIRMMNCSS